jgi:hypothetical protein
MTANMPAGDTSRLKLLEFELRISQFCAAMTASLPQFNAYNL